MQHLVKIDLIDSDKVYLKERASEGVKMTPDGCHETYLG